MTPKHPPANPAREPGSVHVPVNGAELRARRKAKGLTVTALAAAAGVSKQFISALERGISVGINPTAFDKLCRELGCKPAALKLKA